MRLYYFTSSRFGLEAIRDSRLKIARINELNDPFELLNVRLPRAERRILRRWKDSANAQYGLICMSRTWRHPLLWAHYAENYRGMALGFDVPDDGPFEQVRYVEKRPTPAEIGLSKLEDIDEKSMLESFLYKKFSGWSYEVEHRAYCRLEKCDPISDLYFADFSEKMRLAQVVLGERSEVPRSRLERILGDRTGTVSAFKSRAGFQDFEVVENKLQSAWPR